nr:hypothetical protein [Tanacetum cinerariifolium]
MLMKLSRVECRVRLSHSCIVLHQLKVSSLLKGLGSQVLLAKEADSLLKGLLERRNKCHHQTLSRVEVKILCLLLECCTKLTSAAGVHAVASYILKALQVDRSYSEDASIIRSCATILKCLNGSLYNRGFKPQIHLILSNGIYMPLS